MVTIAALLAGSTGPSIRSAVSLPELLRERDRACRLTPDLALESLDEAEGFLRERGLLTRLPDCSLPSLFGACHEEPYKPGSRGFGLWPRTKWPWGFELAERPGVHVLGIHRGKGVFVTAETAALVDPLARDALARAESGELGPEAARLVAHLGVAGPSLLEELVEETGLDPRRPRARLERIGAVVARAVVFDDRHRHSSELARWDQVFPEPSAGGLGKLVVAAVRAAVVAPEDEACGWFSWRASSALIDELVEADQLTRPAPGWLSAGGTAFPRARAGPAP
jgi:hypothetical protein